MPSKVIKTWVAKIIFIAVSKASKEEKARKESTEISPAAPTSGIQLRATSVSLSGRMKDQSCGQRTRRQSQIFTRQTTPPKSVTTAPHEVKRERWSQRRENKLHLEEARWVIPGSVLLKSQLWALALWVFQYEFQYVARGRYSSSHFHYTSLKVVVIYLLPSFICADVIELWADGTFNVRVFKILNSDVIMS